MPKVTARDALARLREGNQRYVQNVKSVDSLLSHSRRGDLALTQEPFAIILGCSDSRAPAEIVFDQGLGDLFVIRVAGNIVAPSGIGSVEFAAERFGTRLVVVMGHAHCGAVEAAIQAIRGQGPGSRNQLSIVDRLRPSIEEMVRADTGGDPDRLRREAVRANVRASVRQLRQGSEIVERLAAEDGLLILGAELDMTTGTVDFFDGLGQSQSAASSG
jgi:carbonic anhydrase